MSTAKYRKLKPDLAANLRHCHRPSWPCWLTAEVAEMLASTSAPLLLGPAECPAACEDWPDYRFDRDGMFWQAGKATAKIAVPDC